MSDTTYKIWYYIDDTPDVSFVSVSLDEYIVDLKMKIHRDNPNSFSQCDFTFIVLTQVDVDLDSVDAIISKGRYQPENQQTLRNRRKISDTWPQRPPIGRLHVFVRLPVPTGSPTFSDATASLDESRSKRRRLATSPNSSAGPDGPNDRLMEKLLQFWTDLWKDKVDPFREDPVSRDPNPVDGVDVPETVKVLRLSRTFSSMKDVMIRDEYGEAMRDIEDYFTSSDKNSVIILGHPGIGKTILLHYILAKRLLEEKPTILQNSSHYLIFFHAGGVRIQNPLTTVGSDDTEYQNTWALVDINPIVERPADMLGPESPFFVVMASSPRAFRLRNLQKHRRPTAYWLMKPFTVAELIQARHLQSVTHKESDIKNFFEKYGPSARDCYESCKARDLDKYVIEVRKRVKEMRWDLITEILTSHPADTTPNEGSHKVLLIGPQPDDRGLPKASIVTKTVGQLLWERDSDEQWRNHRKLFKTLLREASTRGLCGKLFEPAFHALCIRGAKFTIYRMKPKEGRCNYTFTNDQPGNLESNPEYLELSPEGRFFFDDEDEKTAITSLGNCYYQPATSNYPSLDSFVYDQNTSQITAFQVTLAEKHDFKPKGVNALDELGRRLRIDDLKIRVIVVVFGDAKVNFVVNMDLVDSLGLEVYTLKVTENQLYPYPNS